MKIITFAILALSACGPPAKIDPRAQEAFDWLAPIVQARISESVPLISDYAPDPNISLTDEPGSCFGMDNVPGCAPCMGSTNVPGCYDGALSIRVSLVYPTNGPYDFRTVIMHELLHYYGLTMAGDAEGGHNGILFQKIEPELREELFGIARSASVKNELCTAEIACERGVIIMTCRDWNPWKGPGAERRVEIQWGGCRGRKLLA